jgi:uncharacterized protein (TIGR02246 family)
MFDAPCDSARRHGSIGTLSTWRRQLEAEMAQRRFAQSLGRLLMTAILMVAFGSWATAGRAQEKVQGHGTETDAKAIEQVFAEWYEAFSRHDAHAASMTFIEDADFTNMGGAHDHGRKEIEAHLARIFAGNLKNAQRTDMVKSIRFLTPELASVDADTVITGTKAADGSELPPRKGLMTTTMTKQNGRWYIAVFHEIEFPPVPAPAR